MSLYCSHGCDNASCVPCAIEKATDKIIAEIKQSDVQVYKTKKIGALNITLLLLYEGTFVLLYEKYIFI